MAKRSLWKIGQTGEKEQQEDTEWHLIKPPAIACKSL